MKVLITETQPLWRSALAALVSAAGSGVVSYEASDLKATLRLLDAKPCTDLVLLDPALPDAHHLQALEEIRESHPEVPVLVVSDREDSVFEHAVIQAGARALISKRWPIDRFRAAVRLGLLGGTFASAEALVDRMERAILASARVASHGESALLRLRLTPRQRQVLAMLAEGCPNKIICRHLGLAENTVKAHTSAIYRALGVANRTQALAALVRLGVTAEMLRGAPATANAASDGEPELLA